MDHSERRQSIPILYVRGTHYECGFEQGRTFSHLIKSFLETSKHLNDYFLPIYESPEGKKVYEQTLRVVEEQYPQYVNEIRGIADGAQVDFHKLMLFHFDEILPNITKQHKNEIESSGCSTIYLKNSQNAQHLLAHTEDAAKECLNNFYLVSAHVLYEAPFGKHKIKEEKFTSLCYPGHIAGYTMGYNKHGLVYSINTLVAKKLIPNKMPRHFITRHLLTARNYSEAVDILQNAGVGCADGFSVNMKFIDSDEFTNFEIGPAKDDKSQMDLFPVKGDGTFIHCNHYLRMNIEEYADYYMFGTKVRYQTLTKFPNPQSENDIIQMLGDTSHEEHWVYRCKTEYETRTICVGIFDFIKKTWCLYKGNPKECLPLMVLNLNLE